MSTCGSIQEYVKRQYGFTPKTCWIAHVKELCRLEPRVSPNRYDASRRVNSCPPDNKVGETKEAFKYFRMI